MRFEEALRESQVPRRVGDVRLRYEQRLLIGETTRLRGWADGALLMAAVGSGLGCLALLILSSTTASLVGAAGLAILAGLSFAASTFIEQRARRPRRFVLNFDSETLRLEAPARMTGNPRSLTIPFDAIRDVAVVTGPGRGFWLEARFEEDGGERAQVLVDRVAPGEVETLRRVWRLLRDAFGLRS
jgi:hypothetical protein